MIVETETSTKDAERLKKKYSKVPRKATKIGQLHARRNTTGKSPNSHTPKPAPEHLVKEKMRNTPPPHHHTHASPSVEEEGIILPTPDLHHQGTKGKEDDSQKH